MRSVIKVLVLSLLLPSEHRTAWAQVRDAAEEENKKQDWSRASRAKRGQDGRRRSRNGRSTAKAINKKLTGEEAQTRHAGDDDELEPRIRAVHVTMYRYVHQEIDAVSGKSPHQGSRLPMLRKWSKLGMCTGAVQGAVHYGVAQGVNGPLAYKGSNFAADKTSFNNGRRIRGHV